MEKITPDHLARRAIVYVRQSTPQQVRSNLESQGRQYALVERARQLGWRDVELIDEDLGRSGSGLERRPGFERLVAAVSLGKVGAVFGIEVSRLARNSRDWAQLVDLCALTHTLVLDHDGVYDPRLVNDRLLLGLKGTLSEMELGLIRQRSQEALQRMAQRGELYTTLPIGYCRSRENRCEKDPDLRIQQAIHTVFSKFDELGSVRQALLWFRGERFELPAVEYGPFGRTVVWKLPVYQTMLKFLQNPVYAGAYVFGRTETRVSVEGGRARRSAGHRRPVENWQVLIRDHHSGYISWDKFVRNQELIAANSRRRSTVGRGAARGGASLLAGCLRCGACGRMLHVSYCGADGRVVRYSCRGAHLNHGGVPCIAFGGLAVDRAVESEILAALKPEAIEAAMAAAREQAEGEDRRREALALALREAGYEADRAFRQYNVVDPENRLVATELERRWNEALARVAVKERELQALGAGSPGQRPDVNRLRALADDLPRTWRAPTTDMRLKQRIVRTLVPHCRSLGTG